MEVASRCNTVRSYHFVIFSMISGGSSNSSCLSSVFLSGQVETNHKEGG